MIQFYILTKATLSFKISQNDLDFNGFTLTRIIPQKDCMANLILFNVKMMENVRDLFNFNQNSFF